MPSTFSSPTMEALSANWTIEVVCEVLPRPAKPARAGGVAGVSALCGRCGSLGGGGWRYGRIGGRGDRIGGHGRRRRLLTAAAVQPRHGYSHQQARNDDVPQSIHFTFPPL